jgi:hypothetical protein
MRTSKSQRWVFGAAIFALLGASLWLAGKDAIPLLQTVLALFAGQGG